MRFLPEKPWGSRIEVVNETDKTIISWKSQQDSLGKKLGSFVFIIIWTALWSVGIYYFFVSKILITGLDFFSLFSLFIWVAGLVIAVINIVKIIKPHKAAKIILDNSGIVYDAGSNILDGVEIKNYNLDKFANDSQLSRKQYQIPKNHISKILLEMLAEGQVLALETKNFRIEIGNSLSGAEKEWLFKVLSDWKGV